MNIEETLDKYSSLYEKCEEADKERQRLRNKMWDVLYDNEESFKLKDLDGNYTGISLKTLDDVSDIIPGTCILVDGVEWMRVGNVWVSYFNSKKNDAEMFVNILRHRERTYLIHRSY